MRRALIPLVTFALGSGYAPPGDAPRPHARVQDDICLAAIDCPDHPRYRDPRVCLALDTCNTEPDYRLANRHC